MDKLRYEFWGHDTVNDYTFFIKVFENKEKSERVLTKAKRDALSQKGKGRYNFWMVEKTLEEIREQERLATERLERLLKKWNYDCDRLESYVALLTDHLVDIIEKDRQGLIREHSVLLQENNAHESDCYVSIVLEYIKEKPGSSVSTKISFRNGDSITKTNVIGDPFQLFFSWNLYEMLIESFKECIGEAMSNDL